MSLVYCPAPPPSVNASTHGGTSVSDKKLLANEDVSPVGSENRGPLLNE